MSVGNPARLLAPLTLVAAALAIYLVVQSELSDGGAASTVTRPAGGTTSEPASTTSRSERSRDSSRRRARTYTVKPGDVMSSIAEETGVPLSRLQELNPDVDPQALRAGQRLKLRG